MCVCVCTYLWVWVCVWVWVYVHAAPWGPQERSPQSQSAWRPCACVCRLCVCVCVWVGVRVGVWCGCVRICVRARVCSSLGPPRKFGPRHAMRGVVECALCTVCVRTNGGPVRALMRMHMHIHMCAYGRGTSDCFRTRAQVWEVQCDEQDARAQHLRARVATREMSDSKEMCFSTENTRSPQP